MRFGIRRTAMMLALACLAATTASANDWDDFKLHPTIPHETPAMDLTTGQPYYAPPIPYGHYAKDGLGGLGGKAAGLVYGPVGKLKGLFHHGNKACGSCGGKGCGACGGSGLCGDGAGGKGCGLFHKHGAGEPCGPQGCGLSHHGAQGSSFTVVEGGGHHGGGHAVVGGPVVASAQGPEFVTPCDPCGGKGCNLCGGKGCLGGLFSKHCGGKHCGDKACGSCFGGNFDKCGSCGGNGCNLCKGLGKLCHGCGGKGCGLCKGLKGKLLGGLYGLTHPHAGEIEYFVGPGGPVPITPGYVPYIVTTRSPRDFFAFPPFSPDTNP